ncbi:carbohydrate ABC transporter permease [Aquibacillus albus]|uniref:Multiple sugar transport system permease protein n=1 Tax=Aquibacillus albus TaxID=1168171 RepID=A0ABS2N3Q1_9BACI|nr:sugar ABC transporter permease [Aquibacillus albus]MBM7572714.1 multiple sugar transport system permease protein [Aquibacillus albus]
MKTAINQKLLIIRGQKKRNKVKLGSFLFILPAVALNLIFFIYPFLQTLRMSFYEWPLMGEKTYLGLSNFTQIFLDGQFWTSFWFTAKYTLMVTPLIFIIAFSLALLINKRLPGVAFFRAVYFAPVVISMVSSALVWLWIYNDLYGVLNYYLLNLGIVNDPILWMGHASTSLPAISFMITWKMAGFTMIILLAGLQSIPTETYEAASIDGASTLKKILYITIPMLKPSIGLALIVSVIGSVLGFEQFLIMTGGGPSNTTTTIVHYIYNQSFKYFHFGYGSAMTVILLIVLVVLSYIQLRVLRNPADQ